MASKAELKSLGGSALTNSVKSANIPRGQRRAKLQNGEGVETGHGASLKDEGTVRTPWQRGELVIAVKK